MNFLEAYLALDNLDETLRVVSDPDVLYHATEATALFKIFSEDCLRGNVNAKSGINAVCLTTDAAYEINRYPCKIQFSREKLLRDGYELVPYEDFEEGDEYDGESEERVLGDIKNVSKYVTAVYINWFCISVAQSAQGDFISGPVYDELGNEDEEWTTALRDFRILLKRLRDKGIKILKKGEPMTGRYYLDAEGKRHYGKLPMSTAN